MMVSVTVVYEYRPGSLYLNITNRCSNRCTFCVRQTPGFSLAGFDMRLEREPTAAEVLEAVDQALALRGEPFDEVVFCGFGEPTHRLDLIRAVGTTLRQGGQSPPLVRLNTNGQAALLNPGCDSVEELDGALDTVSISLNAPDPETYLELCRPRHGPRAHAAVLDFARRCVGRIPRVTLTVVSGTIGAAQVRRCAELARALGAGFRVR
jgi:TatD family-associated radical SAM protein